MATNTTNYGFKKPDESDFYDVQDQNNNWDLADGALKELDAPTFEDYTGETEVPATATALENIKSKGKLATLLSNIKAFCKGCITLAMLVNDTATNNSQLPVSSAVTHDLQQQLNVLKSNQQKIIRPGANIGGGMCVYTTEATDKGLTRKFSYPNTGGTHDFGFLIVDQNRYADIYAVGISCGVKTILKTSSEAAPSLSGHILSIPLVSWSSVVLITTEKNVTIN